MAFSLSTLAWKSSLNGGCKTVLLSLCDSANTKLSQHYECWPMIETIALYCGTSVRSVQNHLNQLLKNGYISRRRRFMTSSVYRIELTKLHADAEKFDALMRARKEAWASKTSGFDAATATAAVVPEVASLPENPAPLPADFAVYDRQILQIEPVTIEPINKPITKTSAAPAPCPVPAPCPAPTLVAPVAATPAAQPVVVVANEIPENLLADWLLVRKSKGRKVLTDTELDNMRAEAAQAGITLADAMRECVNSGWARFKAAWLPEKPTVTVAPATHVDPAVLAKMAEAAAPREFRPLTPEERETRSADIKRILSTPIEPKSKLAWAEEAIALRRSGVQISYGRLKMAMDALGLSTWREPPCPA